MNVADRESFHVDFEQALAFAARLHAKQVRKETDIPYISHLISVAGLVLEYGGNRDQAIADCTRAITLGSANAGGYVCRGLARAGKGDLRAARDDLDQAVRLDGDMGVAPCR